MKKQIKKTWKLPEVGDWFMDVGCIKKHRGKKYQVQSVDDTISNNFCCIDFGHTGSHEVCNMWIYPNHNLKRCNPPKPQEIYGRSALEIIATQVYGRPMTIGDFVKEIKKVQAIELTYLQNLK